MTEIDCACAQQLGLWKTVENPVDKPVEKSAHTMSLNLITSSLVSDTQQAMLEALEILTARVDAIEHDIWTITGILGSPLSQQEAIDRIRQLRESLD